MIRSSLPTSHGFQAAIEGKVDGMSSVAHSQGRFSGLFNWAATVDQTPYLCVPAAIRFRADICGGEDRIRDYCFSLAHNAGLVISDRLGTEVMQHPKSVLNQCCFTNVRLPLDFHQPDMAHAAVEDGLDPANGPVIVKWIMHRLMYKFNTWIPGKFYNGAIWVRLSAQIYLEMKDFEWAALIPQKLCKRVSRGEWRS
jgi:hercynylcysteine S-oxide lyase